MRIVRIFIQGIRFVGWLMDEADRIETDTIELLLSYAIEL